MDDGSKDNSPSICDHYAQSDERIVVIHKQNGGLVSARQAGSGIAKGEYIVCVDGDDWVDANYLKKMADVIEQYHPDVVCTDYFLAYEQSNVAAHTMYRCGLYSRVDLEEEIFPTLICGKGCKSFPQSLWAKAFNAQIYKRQQMMINHKVVRGEDVVCTYPVVSKSQSLYIIPESLYYYRQNPSSITKVKKAYPWNGPMLIGEVLEKTIFTEKFNFRNQIDWCIINELFNVAASQFHKNQSYFKTRKEILKNLNKPNYKKVLSKCHLQYNIRDLLVLTSLKLRVTFIMKLYCKAKL